MAVIKSFLEMTKKTSLFFFLLLFSFCSSSDQQSESLQIVTTTNVNSENEIVEDASDETTTTTLRQLSTSDYYDQMEFSISQDYFAQEIVVSNDVPQSIVDEYIEVQSLMNETIGSYNRYVMIIYTDNENSENVFKKLKEIHWPHELNIVDGYIVAAGCLTGSGYEINPPDVYAICLMDYKFVNNPHEAIERGLSDGQRKALLYHGWVHEYFHRYQRGYHRELNMGTPEVGTPSWWIEGAAIVFPNIWLSQNYQSISTFAGLEFQDVNVEGMDLNNWYKSIRRSAQGKSFPGDGCANYEFGVNDEQYETMRCFIGIANAYLAYITSYQTVWVDIPSDIYELGFAKSFEKHVGMTMDEFYIDFNAFLRDGDPESNPPEGFWPTEPINSFVSFP